LILVTGRGCYSPAPLFLGAVRLHRPACSNCWQETEKAWTATLRPSLGPLLSSLWSYRVPLLKDFEKARASSLPSQSATPWILTVDILRLLMVESGFIVTVLHEASAQLTFVKLDNLTRPLPTP
jgi:hypothetical protein